MLNDSVILQGSITAPKPAYSTEVLTLQVSNANGSHVFAIKAVDDDNKKSELSNIVSTNLEFFEEARKRALKPEEPKNIDSHGVNVVAIAVGFSVGVVILLAIIISAVVIVKQKKSRDLSKSSRGQQTYNNKGYSA